jgi:hypothetical protein
MNRARTNSASSYIEEVHELVVAHHQSKEGPTAFASSALNRPPRSYHTYTHSPQSELERSETARRVPWAAFFRHPAALTLFFVYWSQVSHAAMPHHSILCHMMPSLCIFLTVLSRGWRRTGSPTPCSRSCPHTSQRCCTTTSRTQGCSAWLLTPPTLCLPWLSERYSSTCRTAAA